MARAALTATAVPNPYAATGTLIAWGAADTSNKNQIVLTGRELVIAWNSGATSRTVTVTSVADRYGRTKDIAAQAIAPGEHIVYACGLSPEGWQQADGNLYLEATHAEVKFGVLKLT